MEPVAQRLSEGRDLCLHLDVRFLLNASGHSNLGLIFLKDVCKHQAYTRAIILTHHWGGTWAIRSSRPAPYSGSLPQTPGSA